MPTAFGTPQHWRERAEQARKAAEAMAAPDAKRAMLTVADNYERLAEWSEARATDFTPPLTDVVAKQGLTRSNIVALCE